MGTCGLKLRCFADLGSVYDYIVLLALIYELPVIPLRMKYKNAEPLTWILDFWFHEDENFTSSKRRNFADFSFYSRFEVLHFKLLLLVFLLPRMHFRLRWGRLHNTSSAVVQSNRTENGSVMTTYCIKCECKLSIATHLNKKATFYLYKAFTWSVPSEHVVV